MLLLLQFAHQKTKNHLDFIISSNCIKKEKKLEKASVGSASPVLLSDPNFFVNKGEGASEGCVGQEDALC